METDYARSIFVTGIRNAHAMEKQALSILNPQLTRIEHYPEVADRIEAHIRETEGQISRLEEILHGLSETHSTLKDVGLSISGSMAAMGHTMAGDEILKNSFANFAFENFEIAAYRSLLLMGENGGFTSAVSALNENLREEQAMAAWLEEHLSMVTSRFISLSEAGEKAKV
ncbi:ferritin-like domain-containing protein [Agrobacterium sp. CG674]